MTKGCLGPDPPRVHGKLLAIDSIESMIFEEGDDTPLLDPSAVDYVGKNKDKFININLPCELSLYHLQAYFKFCMKEDCTKKE
jgi:hypothetical protein